MSLYESFDFYEVITEVANIAFSLERVYGRTFLTEFFPGVFFFQAKEKIHQEKDPAETQSKDLQVKSEETPVHKDVGKIMQNIGSRRLTPKSAKLIC